MSTSSCWVPSEYLLYEKGQNGIVLHKRHLKYTNLIQVIKGNINSDKSCQQPWYDVMNMARYLCDLSPQINNPDLIVKKKYENSSIGTFYKTPDQYSSKPNVVKKKEVWETVNCHNSERLRRYDN